MRYATETSAIQFLFSFTFRWITFLTIFFLDPEKNTLVSSKSDETMTTGYFLGGGEGGNLPPLTAVFPPFRLAVIIVYYIFQKIMHPQDPPTTGSYQYSPPFKISLENTLTVHVYLDLELCYSVYLYS